jgi:hypothetical protein
VGETDEMQERMGFIHLAKNDDFYGFILDVFSWDDG